MTADTVIRIDKYLWAVRIYKTRTLAAEACSSGKVKLNGESVKPSRHVKPGEVYAVRQGYITRTYRVLRLLEKRVSAKVAANYAEDLTPQEELDKIKTERLTSYIRRYRGTGRPTKKERRLMEKFKP